MRFLNILFDLFAINIIAGFILYYDHSLALVGSLFWINLSWFVSTYFAKLYLYKNLVYFREGLKASFKALLFFFVINITVDFFILGSYFLVKSEFNKILTVFTIVFLISRMIFYLLKKYFSLEFYWNNHVLTIGDLKIATLLKKQFAEKKELGYKHILHYEENEVGLEASFIKELKEKEIDEVFFVNPQMDQEKLYQYIQLLEHNSIRVKFVPDFQKFHTKPNHLTLIGDYPVLYLRKEPLESLFNRMTKRAFDIAFSLMVILLLLSWLYPIIAILIKLESKGPVVYRQRRSGRDNDTFWCLKFRSMRMNKEADIQSATKNDPRVTRIGSFLRKSSLDELPQFLNVIIGNMSVVGPRPHMVTHTRQYGNVIDKYMVRHFVKPGITGWAQVHGLRGEMLTTADIENRIEKDVWYIENWSFSLDIQIILLTIYNIFKGEEKAY
jgi:Undecaprenyl-phosphate glucose phosphotransferase